MQQKITPFLWFDDKAEEAVEFYTSIFKNSKIGNVARYDKAGAEVSGRPEESAMTVDCEIEGHTFTLLNGGPIFKFTPAVSYFVNCETEEEIDKLWNKLSHGGKVLMEFQKYPFSEKYGWLEDKYGVSWQLNLSKGGQKITPSLLFTQKVAGKAEEAIKFYTSLFENSEIQTIARYEKGDGDTEGNVKFSKFTLFGQEFMAMDSGLDHAFTFTEANSFVVNCENQAEVDKLWGKLSAVPESEQCGWLKDKYGLSWQIVPRQLGELLSDSDKEKAGRVMQAMLQMKKIDVAGLKKAYEGK